jgi:hypothetical protein
MKQSFGPWSDGSDLPLGVLLTLLIGSLTYAAVGGYMGS